MAEPQQGADRPAPRQKQTSFLPRVLAASAVLALLVACAPAAPSPGPSPTTASATPTATPTPSPSDQPTPDSTPTPDATDDDPDDRSELLEQPKAMENDDEEGAIAAAKYYVGLFEYVHLTGDLEMWNAMALPECEFCEAVADGVAEMHESGLYRASGPPKWLGKPKTRRVHSRVMWEVTLRAEMSASTTFDRKGAVVEESRSAKNTVTLGMLHDGESWRTLGIVVSSDE